MIYEHEKGLVFCPTCKAQGKKSRVYDQGKSSTLLAYQIYWDEEGRPHYHNPNKIIEHYACSENHTWSENFKSKCWCGWNSEEIEKKESEVKTK